MYDGLLTRDAPMHVVPELAESWRQIDPVTYEFHLRHGVRFHDGSPMTAEDVKFTFERVMSGKIGGMTNPRKDLLGPLNSVDIVDPHTVRFVLSAPWPLLPAMLPFQEIVSEAFVKKVGDAGMVTQEDGTGAFRLKEWVRGDRIVMERFPDYYGGSPAIPPVGPAKVDRVIYKVMPDNASRVAALLAGDIDIINELPVTSIDQVRDNPGTTVMTVNGTRTFFLAINNDRPPFTDVRVRQALNHAVDRKLIVAKLMNGLATPLNGVLSPDAFGFDAESAGVRIRPGAGEGAAGAGRCVEPVADDGYGWGIEGHRRGHRIDDDAQRHRREGAGVGDRGDRADLGQCREAQGP